MKEGFDIFQDDGEPWGSGGGGVNATHSWSWKGKMFNDGQKDS